MRLTALARAAADFCIVDAADSRLAVAAEIPDPSNRNERGGPARAGEAASLSPCLGVHGCPGPPPACHGLDLWNCLSRLHSRYMLHACGRPSDRRPSIAHGQASLGSEQTLCRLYVGRNNCVLLLPKDSITYPPVIRSSSSTLPKESAECT